MSQREWGARDAPTAVPREKAVPFFRKSRRRRACVRSPPPVRPQRLGIGCASAGQLPKQAGNGQERAQHRQGHERSELERHRRRQTTHGRPNQYEIGSAVKAFTSWPGCIIADRPLITIDPSNAPTELPRPS